MRLACAPELNGNGRVPFNKREYEGDMSGNCVQNKKLCIEGGVTNNNEEDLTKFEQQVETAKQKMNSKAWKSFSKRQKALLVGQDIRSRGGLQQRLMFRGQGKTTFVNRNEREEIESTIRVNESEMKAANNSSSTVRAERLAASDSSGDSQDAQCNIF